MYNDYRKGNHRTKKKGAKGSKPYKHDILDGAALLKEMKKEATKKGS